MKKIKFILIMALAVISFNACEENDDLVFTAAPVGEFEFVNTFLSEYVLTPQTSSNVAERFVFNDAEFGVPTNINYQLQYSALGDFSDAQNIGGESMSNEIGLTVGDFLSLATEAGLDNDPDTEASNTGTFAFRVRAYPGDASSTTEQFSPVAALTAVLPEIVAGGGGSEYEISEWGVVGSGYNDWGNGGPDGLFYTTSESGVIVSYVSLIDGQIKFRTNNDWGSGDDLGDAGSDGVLDQDPDNNINVTAGDYKITINTNDNSYTIEPYSWGVVGSGYNDWGNAGPDGKLYYDYTTDTFKASLKLVDGEIKFRSNNDWGSGDDFGDAGLDGVLDQDADNNITVTEGHYLITVNFNTNEYSIVEADVWGIVGSGYNDWGNDGPDFALTEIQENILYGDIATLIDGEIKFRSNNDWGSGDDFGDADLDGVLDRDADNNITVAAGLYRVRVDLNDNTYQLNKIQ
ncbi:SusE domain-containing protein [Flavisericum labens]|uniref:SusE domain-containing protein n=1 Tax=Flavisericum labens TaxID=3377112 RepID=UPI00387B163D